MGDTSDFSDEEFRTALAAAAYAIAVLAEEASPRRSAKESEKKEDNIKKSSESIRVSRWLSGKDPGSKSTRKSTTLQEWFREDDADTKVPEKTTKKASTFSGEYRNDTGMADTKKPKKAIGTTPTVKKMPTFSDTYLNDTGSKRFEGLPYRNDTELQKKGTDAADSWEREEMAKIRKWHEKMNSTILQWENEKKTRARRRKERKERELELWRARLLQEYRNEMSRIDKIAGGARKVSDQRRRNDEFKTKEIARMIRSTGKVPNTWFCICN